MSDATPEAILRDPVCGMALEPMVPTAMPGRTRS
jgi:hypothetical protein